MPRRQPISFVEAADLDDLQLTIERAHNAELRAELEVRLPTIFIYPALSSVI
jgi:hypothetical protein